MKRTIIHFFVTSLAISIGLSLLWFLSMRQNEEDLAPKPVAISTSTPQGGRARFKPTARGCGSGYVQSYELPDGQTMIEGSVGYPSKHRTKKEYKEWLAKATSVIERVPDSKNRFGNIGERIVALFPTDATGKEWATILWYDGGSYFSYIQAPSVELALEFEKNNAYAY
jgi:hypothetical protein